MENEKDMEAKRAEAVETELGEATEPLSIIWP